MTDIISTGIAIDSSDAVKAKQDLDNLAGAGDKVDGALSKIDQAGARTGKTLATLSQNTRKVAETSAQMVAQMQQLNTAQGRQEALLKSIGSSFAGLTAAIKGATTATQAQAKAAADSAKATSGEAIAAKQAAQAAREQQRAADQAAAAKASAVAAADRYIQKLRDEVQLHGASRSAIEAHRSAQMGLTAEQQKMASVLGGQLDALNKNKNALSLTQQAAIGVGSAMATAFVVKRVYDFADALFQASVNAQRIKTTLQFATGDSAKEFAYVTKLADDLGLQLTSTAQAYASFAAASKGTALEGEGARKVFESISKAAAVMGLSSEQASGALLALQQMVSKGTVQAEELRGQLGERLPGAFQIAAKAMGVTTAELGKMLEQGQIVASDFLPKFADALNAYLGDAPEKAANRLDASVNRMDNAWERLKRSLGDSGFSESMAGQYNILTDAFNGVSEAIDGAKREGDGFVGQMLAATGAVASFLNPLNAVSYSAQSSGEKLKEAEARLSALQARAKQGIDVHVQMGRLEELIAKLREAKAAADAAGGASVAGGGRGSVNPPTAAQIATRQAAFQGDLGAYLNDNSRQTKAQIREEEYAKARKKNADLVTRAEGDQNAILKLQAALKTEIANIDEKYKDKKGAGAGVERATDRSQLRSDLEAIQREQESKVDRNANTQRLLEAQRSAGLVDEQDYYAKRLELLQSDDRAQEQSLQDQIARLQKESFAGKNATKDQIDNQNKIDELRAKLTKTQEAAATNEQVLSIQATSALNQQRAALVSARQAAQDYLDTTQRGYDRQIAGIGKGTEARGFDSGISQIEERYEQQRQNIQSQRAQAQALAGGTLTAQVQKQFDDQLALQDEFQGKSIDAFKRYYAAQKEAQSNWLNGATEALQNYIDEASNASKRAEDLVTQGLSGLNESITDALWDGDLDSFKEFGDRIGKQILSGIVEQQFTKPIAEWLQGSLKDDGSIVSQLLGGLTSTKGTGENWLGSLLGTGKKGDAAGSDPLGDFIGKLGIGDAAGAASTASMAASATAATVSLTSLAAAAGAAALAMGGSSISSALGIANSVGASGGDSLGSLIGLMGWADGGFTGPGAKYQPAGIVHAGEYVVNAENTRRLGLGFLERLNKRGYSDGGYVRNIAAGSLGGASSTPMRGGDTYISVPVEGRVDRETRNQIANRLSLQQRKAGRLQ
jgi:lambda family phage tail tape measure protein